MTLRRKSALIALFALMSAVGGSAAADDRHGLPKDSERYRRVIGLDTAVFDAFNTCDLQKLGSYFAEDVEFFHDNDGLSVGRQSFLDAVKKNICGKMRRQLVTDSVEVYPMNTYGALQTGTHRFLHPGREAIDGVGAGKFIHLWQNKNGVWKITRVVSFDHHAVDEPALKTKR